MLHFVSLISHVHFSYSRNENITVPPNVIVLVCQGCQNKILQAGGFKQRKLFLSLEAGIPRLR